MAAPKDFVTGFNHNVRHKGQGFHVQTEDSGSEIAHIITHLFQGGNILASKKTSYADLRGAPDLKAKVRHLMEEQHRQMLRQLVNGAFDAVADGAPNVATAPERAVPLVEDAAPIQSAPPKRSSPIEVIRFAPPADREAAANAEQAPTGFLPSLPRPRPAVMAPPVGFDPHREPSSPTPSPSVPLWPTALEAAGLVTRCEAPVAAASSRTPTPLPTSGVVVERTPGPAAWRPDSQAETIFGEDGAAAEKSLDQVILRYLAGERDD